MKLITLFLKILLVRSSHSQATEHNHKEQKNKEAAGHANQTINCF